VDILDLLLFKIGDLVHMGGVLPLDPVNFLLEGLDQLDVILPFGVESLLVFLFVLLVVFLLGFKIGHLLLLSREY
jgi:hypothetical protein